MHMLTSKLKGSLESQSYGKCFPGVDTGERLMQTCEVLTKQILHKELVSRTYIVV